jgi:uncharacterized repeat protein (TIGR01451 family)
MKRIPLFITLGIAAMSLLFQGCETAATAPEPEPEQNTESPGMAVAEINERDVVSLRKSVNEFATVGGTFDYRYEITAQSTVKDVVLSDMVPEGLTFLGATPPPASSSGGELVWEFNRMEADATQVVTATMRADEVGQYRNCATITAVPIACTTVTVAEASLLLTKTADRNTVQTGETVNFNITVRNTGTATAENLVITDEIPMGLADPQGRSVVTFNVPSLAPGATESFQVPLQATQRGEFVNPASVRADNVVEDENDQDTAQILVLIPGLEVEKTGTQEQFTGKRAQYEIAVENVGETQLRDVIVTDTLPMEYELLQSDGGNYDAENGTVTWTIPALASGDTRTYQLVVGNTTAGTFTNEVEAVDEDTGLSDDGEQTTVWRGFPAILLEMIDTKDPLTEGETTTYEISVTNQGTANDFNVSVTAAFPTEVVPVNATGATEGTINGNIVTFPAVPVLEPKEEITYTITGRASELGDARVTVRVTSDLIEQAVDETESTQVY